MSPNSIFWCAFLCVVVVVVAFLDEAERKYLFECDSGEQCGEWVDSIIKARWDRPHAPQSYAHAWCNLGIQYDIYLRISFQMLTLNSYSCGIWLIK